jgi:hypothetical protein
MPISSYTNRVLKEILPMTVTLTLTIEEATAYVEALDRATDNPFIQDDDDCAPLYTLLGKLEAVANPLEIEG